jgi:hypothetical protein
MKQLKSFIKKEFFHIFRDPRTMLILFGIPVVQLLVFGTVIKSEIKDVHIAIYDQSKDETTQEITNKLLSSGYFILDENLDNLDGIDAIFRKGKVREVIVFENNFGQTLGKEGTAKMQLIADASDPNIAKLAISYTTAIVNDYIRKLYPEMQCLYVCSGSNGTDFNAHFGHDDLHINYPREGVGNHGNFACFATSPCSDYCWQGTPLSFTVDCQCLYYRAYRAFCI